MLCTSDTHGVTSDYLYSVGKGCFEAFNSGKYIAIFVVYILCDFCACLSISFCE